jgi:hypothetical protein
MAHACNEHPSSSSSSVDRLLLIGQAVMWRSLAASISAVDASHVWLPVNFGRGAEPARRIAEGGAGLAGPKAAWAVTRLGDQRSLSDGPAGKGLCTRVIGR